MDGKYVTARKDHVCDLCPWAIPAGMEYWREDATPWDHPDNDGYFTIKAHRLCINFHAANRRENGGLIQEWQWSDELLYAAHGQRRLDDHHFDTDMVQDGNMVTCGCGLTIDLTNSVAGATTSIKT